uniref:IQ motif containing B1 n=1 Tax=Gasterosteus aculeatus aculeatus TaxID=481459 RepID=G3P8C8_GASAC|nr:IQ calmodulin-binding motif-containing protein 1 [Gasterosteus aculeatus aculeatus]XP_040025860.1 IQ calmodulin-binding motif-containing protein 1 [Gasterosteus aculeatus aculeatus]XP_040025862.1 IQ calmodulin-binding motif-containing protein 1 [Gasterosteus aculeatus aculeatus]XP_040025863.1 IQ calmodulin-binding motif-containing protein 1 [Gasterosteus aculeatus aculeatus]
MELMELVQEEALVAELKRKLEDEDLKPEQKVLLLNDALNKTLTTAALRSHGAPLAAGKSLLYRSGVLSHCVRLLTPDPRRPRGNWGAAATLAALTSSCCVGVDPGPRSQAFHRLFLPSLMDGLLSLASQLMRRAECPSLFRQVMDSVGWMLRSHTCLTTQVLSSVHYEHIQMCDDVTVSLLCVEMWVQTCTASRDFLSELSDDSVLLLLNEAVGQLAVSADSSVGVAAVRLILLMANQQEEQVQPLLLSFKGLDSLLDKDWKGRGFDQEVDQLIALIQADTRRRPQVCTERERAACLIQAAWRSFQTRRRVKNLNRAVSRLQRTYRARRRRQQQQKEAQQWEEELRYQVCVRRQQARRKFHQKQRQLLQLLPADQVQPYLKECECRAAVLIQSFWRGFRERQRYNNTTRHARTQQQAARTLQRAVRLFLRRRRAAFVPPTTSLLIGQRGLTDSRRLELKRQVEEHISLHPSSQVSHEEAQRLHEEAQLLLSALQGGEQQRRREEQRVEALLAHTHTQLELLREAPPLSVVTTTAADSFLSRSSLVVMRARDSHNAALQAHRLPWWRTLGDSAGHVGVFGQVFLPELEAELGGLFVGGE